MLVLAMGLGGIIGASVRVGVAFEVTGELVLRLVGAALVPAIGSRLGG